MLTVTAVQAAWMVTPVLLATRRQDRFRGVGAGIARVLLRTGSVHGRGLVAPLRLVGIDATGTVCCLSELAPRQFRTLRNVTWILELPFSDPVPPIGSKLAIYPRIRERETHSVRNPHRQSRRCLEPSQE